MKTWIVVMLMVLLPVLAPAAAKTHMKTDGQDCAECHSVQEQVWLGGKHGLMNVKCVVCHGSPEEAEAGLDPSHEQKRVCAADRRGLLRVVASPDGRRWSMRIHQDALLYSALL